MWGRSVLRDQALAPVDFSGGSDLAEGVERQHRDEPTACMLESDTLVFILPGSGI